MCKTVPVILFRAQRGRHLGLLRRCLRGRGGTTLVCAQGGRSLRCLRALLRPRGHRGGWASLVSCTARPAPGASVSSTASTAPRGGPPLFVHSEVGVWGFSELYRVCWRTSLTSWTCTNKVWSSSASLCRTSLTTYIRTIKSGPICRHHAGYDWRFSCPWLCLWLLGF